jgi:hypothetical protein
MSINQLLAEGKIGEGLDIEVSKINVKAINNLSPTGGVYMTTSSANIITSTTTETSLLVGSAGIGSLTIPANGFTVSSYHLNLSGRFSSKNGDTATLRLKTGSVDMGSIVSDLTGSTNESFEIEVDFSIRVLGGSGTAEISTNFDFTFSDGSTQNWRGDRNVEVNSTTFSTEISNTLDITVQFNSTSVNNSIQCLQVILTKTY